MHHLLNLSPSVTTTAHTLERQGSSIKLADETGQDTKTLVAMFALRFSFFVSTGRRNSTVIKENGSQRTTTGFLYVCRQADTEMVLIFSG
jgi:hypothetical protein